MQNSILRARRIAFFRAVEAAAEVVSARSSRQNPLANPWTNIRADRQARYLAGTGRVGEALLGELTAEYPEAAKVLRADVWDFLDSGRTPLGNENRLFEECSIRRSACAVDDLLAQFHDSRPSTLGNGLDEVSLRVLALRVAVTSKLPEAALAAAVDLAVALLTLSGCPYRRFAAEQLWRHCGHTLVRGLRFRGRSMQYRKETWNLVSDHASALTSTFKVIAYASPHATELPFPTVEELLRDIVTAVTTEDLDRATFISSRFNVMSPYQYVAQPGAVIEHDIASETRRKRHKNLISPLPFSDRSLPDVESVSIWVSS